jgi:hypothetical protein
MNKKCRMDNETSLKDLQIKHPSYMKGLRARKGSGVWHVLQPKFIHAATIQIGTHNACACRPWLGVTLPGAGS